MGMRININAKKNNNFCSLNKLNFQNIIDNCAKKLFFISDFEVKYDPNMIFKGFMRFNHVILSNLKWNLNSA